MQKMQKKSIISKEVSFPGVKNDVADSTQLNDDTEAISENNKQDLSQEVKEKEQLFREDK